MTSNRGQVLIQIWQYGMHLNNVAFPQVQFLVVIEQCLRELATVSVSAGQGHIDRGQLLGLQTLQFSQTQLKRGAGGVMLIW